METVLTYNDLLAKVTALEKLLRSKDEDIKHRDEVITRKDEDIKRKEERIAYLERLLFGSRRDKLVSQGPTLFDELFNQAVEEYEAAIVQAPAPVPVIGGNHVGADLLAQLVVDKFTYHIPEYRQVRQYADMGVRLPA